jgi:hypothetical protein
MFLVTLVAVSFSEELNEQDYNTFTLQDGTKLLVNKKTDEPEYMWNKKQDRWSYLGHDYNLVPLSESIGSTLKSRYYEEKKKQLKQPRDFR